MPRSLHGGRHELGQNFLHDRAVIDRIVALVRRTRGDILEIGAGDGALTHPLARLGRPLVAIDIDERRVARLARSATGVRVVHGDALQVPLRASVIVGNVPFHLTTPILRRLFAASSWNEAIVLTQWEVARKRAGVGGGTMMTAAACPWFEVALICRVPARCFRPMPSVDGGVIRVIRRARPLVADRERRAYEHFVTSVFTGRGADAAAAAATTTVPSAGAYRRALGRVGDDPQALPRAVSTAGWVELWRVARAST